MITGAVRDENGQGTPGVRLIAGNENAVTDDRGRYRLYRIPPGYYRLGILYEGPQTRARSNFGYYPLHSEPRTFTGCPAKSSATARDRPAVSIAHLRTEADGSFDIGGVPPGSCDLFVAGPSQRYTFREELVGPDAL